MFTQEPAFCLCFTDTQGTFRSYCSSNAGLTQSRHTLNWGVIRVNCPCSGWPIIVVIYFSCQSQKRKTPSCPSASFSVSLRDSSLSQQTFLFFKKINGVFSYISLISIIASSCYYVFADYCFEIQTNVVMSQDIKSLKHHCDGEKERLRSRNTFSSQHNRVSGQRQQKQWQNPYMCSKLGQG